MAQAKYKEYYQKMLDENKVLFEQFSIINKKFGFDPDSCEKDFHQIGQKVVDKIRDWDRRLCSAMGKGVYSSYSQKLSEKFWSLVRADFDQIDMVGVKVKKAKK